MDIVTKLDTLAEYHSQKDAIELKKRELLAEVKTPDEVIEIQRQAAAAVGSREAKAKANIEALRAETKAALDAVQIPDEVRELLAEIDRKRREITQESDRKNSEIVEELAEYRALSMRETEARTRQVFDDLATRKAEIEFEFSGAARAVDENIRALEDEIKADTENEGKTVKGKYFMAVYNRGRITWNTDMMEAWINDHPFLKSARKEGKPSISLRRI